MPGCRTQIFGATELPHFSGPSSADDTFQAVSTLSLGVCSCKQIQRCCSAWAPCGTGATCAGQPQSLASGSRLWRRIQSLSVTKVSSFSGPSSSSWKPPGNSFSSVSVLAALASSRLTAVMLVILSAVP